MRVADKMNFSQVTRNLNRNRSEAANLQNQAATMKRVTKPSDDPLAATRVLAARTDSDNFEQYEKNLNMARSFLELSDQTLAEVGSSLIRLKELALGQANEVSANKISRRTVATEVKQIFAQIVQMGNRKFGDRHIFGGYNTMSPPFNSRGEYAGDDGQMMIEINGGAYLPMNSPGSTVFLGKNLGIQTTAQRTGAKELLQQEFKTDSSEEQDEIKNFQPDPQSLDEAQVRAPASVDQDNINHVKGFGGGENLFHVVKQLEIGLMSNDTPTIQDTLERLDETISQVVMARAQIGSRAAALDSARDMIHKGQIESKVTISNQEDANTFELFSDLKKNETTLQATLQTSGKLLQGSLLDFLR